MAWPGRGNGWWNFPGVMLMPLLMANRRRAIEIALAMQSRGITPDMAGGGNVQPMAWWEKVIAGGMSTGLVGYLALNWIGWPGVMAWLGGSP